MARPQHHNGWPGHSHDVKQAAEMPVPPPDRSSHTSEPSHSGEAAVHPVTTTTTTTAPASPRNDSQGSPGHNSQGSAPPAVPASSTTAVPTSGPPATPAVTTHVTTGTTTPVTSPPTTVGVEPAVMTAVPVQPVVAAPPPRPVTSVPARPAAPGVKAVPAVRPAPVIYPGAFGEPMVLARGAWKGLSLRAATDLKIPIVMLVGVALFLLGQALIDRRDPKVSAAPERGTDDTIGFE